MGHDEPFVVLDAGLRRDQRFLLERVAEVVNGTASHPLLAKTQALLLRPARVQIVLDADVVAVRSLGPLVTRAEHGVVVAFVDDQPERFYDEWTDATGAERLYRHPYLNAGVIVLPEALGRRVTDVVARVQAQIDITRTRLGTRDKSYAFYFPDQDAWNAAFAALVPPERLAALEHELAPMEPVEDVIVEDEQTLSCRRASGARPFVLHHISQKPWLVEQRPTAYSRLLTRLLQGEDVALRLPARALPLWLRRGGVPRALAAARRWLLARSVRTDG
jgi:hypothetical protein